MRCLDYDTSVLLAFKLVKVPDISVGTPEQQRGGGTSVNVSVNILQQWAQPVTAGVYGVSGRKCQLEVVK